ncbi:MAG: deoxyribodipyrimidine photo-lyase, partial [Kineosporiaceae bacterium]
MTTTILWLRRDLRLSDHPALLMAGADGARVLPLFVIDPALWGPSGAPRRVMLVRSLRALDAAMDGHLVVRHGDPVRIVPEVAAQARADAVHVSADAGPYGRARDESVALALREAGRALVRTGTPYAIGPGTLLNGSGTPYQVFTPFRTAWLRHGWPAPATAPAHRHWAKGVHSDELPKEPDLGELTLP